METILYLWQRSFQNKKPGYNFLFYLILIIPIILPISQYLIKTMICGNTLNYRSIENNEVSTLYENGVTVEEDEEEEDTPNERQYIETDFNEQFPFHQGIHRSKRNQILG